MCVESKKEKEYGLSKIGGTKVVRQSHYIRPDLKKGYKH